MSAGHYHPYRRLQSSLSLSSDHQDWLDNIQRLRERIASQIQASQIMAMTNDKSSTFTYQMVSFSF